DREARGDAPAERGHLRPPAALAAAELPTPGGIPVERVDHPHAAILHTGANPPPVKRVTIIASASGSGKTTVGRRLAELLEVPYHELDAIHHQAGWRELEAQEFRRRVEPIVARDGWVIDGVYRGKLGDLALERADTVIWLDLPRRIWLPRLVRRTFR